MSKIESPPNHPDTDTPEFRISPLQQALASCTGAIITSLFGKKTK